MLDGQIVAVTGGAGLIGSALVRDVVKNGGRAIIGDLSVDKGIELQKELGIDNALFVESEEGEFMLREVETGASVGGWIQIISGVSAGERVVTEGAFALKSEADKSMFGDGHGH